MYFFFSTTRCTHPSSSSPYATADSTGANCVINPFIAATTDPVLRTMDGSRGPAPPRSFRISSVVLLLARTEARRGAKSWPLLPKRAADEREKTDRKRKQRVHIVYDVVLIATEKCNSKKISSYAVNFLEAKCMQNHASLCRRQVLVAMTFTSASLLGERTSMPHELFYGGVLARLINCITLTISTTTLKLLPFKSPTI